MIGWLRTKKSTLFLLGAVFFLAQSIPIAANAQIPPWQFRASVLDLYDPYGQGVVTGVGYLLGERTSLALDIGGLVINNGRWPTTGWKTRLGFRFYKLEESGNALIFHGPEIGWKRRIQARGEYAERLEGQYREYVTFLQKGQDISLHYLFGTALFPDNHRFGVEISVGLGARTFRHFIRELPMGLTLADPGFPLGINPREGWVVLPSASVRMLFYLSPWLD